MMECLFLFPFGFGVTAKVLTSQKYTYHTLLCNPITSILSPISILQATSPHPEANVERHSDGLTLLHCHTTLHLPDRVRLA